jgi:hypothetical protein
MTFRKLIAAGAATAALAVASQASAAVILTFDLGAPGDFTTAPSYSYTVGGVNLTVSGDTYQFDPNGLTGHTAGDLTASRLERDSTGIGVCNSGETVAATAPCSTVDTAAPQGQNNTDKNEAAAFVFSKNVKLMSIVISQFQTDSTLGLWTVAPGTGALTTIFHLNPITGASPLTVDLSGLDSNGQAWALTAFGGKDNGYHIDSISVQAGAVPEAATWGLMIVGFAGVGAAVRSRRQKLSAAA